EGILFDGRGNALLTDLENLRPKDKEIYVQKRDDFEKGVRTLIEEGVRNDEFECKNSKLASLAILGSVNWISKWYSAEGPLGMSEVADGIADFHLRALIKSSQASAESE